MLFKNITILNENLDIENNMYVGIKGDTIEYIGNEPPSADYGEGYDGKGKLLMSGFFNAHGHSPMTLMRGYGENLSLQDWLFTRIFPFEDKLTSQAVYAATLLAMAESIKFGIISTSDMYYFVEDMIRAVKESGAKSNISRSIVTVEGKSFNEMPSIIEMKDAIKRFHGDANGRILMDTSLHAEYTTNERLARELAEFTKDAGLIMHVHVSETKSEHEECKERHGGRTPVQYLNDCGIFDSPALAAHCVWIEGEDFDILKDRGVTVATNPCSNLKLASGVCDVSKLIKKGINVAIGTDSVASNNSLNFIEEMKTLGLIAKVKSMDPTVITPKEVLRAATLGGALGQGRKNTGALKKGYKADLIVMDIGVPNMQPIHDMVSNIVYSSSSSDIVLTMVDGKTLYKDGEFTTIDIEKAIFETDKQTKDILGRL
ncbi:MAG TPA: amidohydrolase [Anaerovoracaceae bacterium]|nr:amidohydrolase [Anaerovoracaceae bacterium]